MTDFKSRLSRVCPRLVYLFLLRLGLLTVQDLWRPEKRAYLYLTLRKCGESGFVPWAKLSFPSFCQARVACIPLHNHAHTGFQSEMKISERGNTQDSKQNREGWMSVPFSPSFPTVVIRMQLCAFPNASVCPSACLPHPPITFDNFCMVHCNQIWWKVEVSEIITWVWVL